MTLFTITSLIFFAVGILSMLTHGLKKWAMGEIKGGLVDWYVMHPRATVLAVMTCLGGIATAILSGALDNYTVGAQLLAAWGIGYGADSLNSQDEKKK